MAGEIKKKPCACPFCEGELAEAFLPFCQGCGTEIRYCERCGKPLPKGVDVCPNCN